MRISDWSSDVCSSDLLQCRRRARCTSAAGGPGGEREAGKHSEQGVRLHAREGQAEVVRYTLVESAVDVPAFERRQHGQCRALQRHGVRVIVGMSLERDLAGLAERSEEHTSELQSLMRI